jgi:hypothetical protein
MCMRLVLLATLFYASLAAPIFAEAAGWVLIQPPRDNNGDVVRDVPVNGSWRQMAAFDDAAQCEGRRWEEIKGWELLWKEHPEWQWLEREWIEAFLLRCMPYDLWWRAQQPPR